MRIEPREALICIDSKVREGIEEGTIRKVGESIIWGVRNDMVSIASENNQGEC